YMPVLLPSVLLGESYLNQLGRIDGVLLSSGNDVGVENSVSRDRMRDDAEATLLHYAIKYQIPVLGVCRGMQFIQYFFGGKLSRIASGHIGTGHDLVLLQAWPWRKEQAIKVNSYHHWGVQLDALSTELIPLAKTQDEVVEALQHRSLPIWGVQWH